MKSFRNFLLSCLPGFGAFIFSCIQHGSAPTAFQLMENTGIDFSNTIKSDKDFNIFSYRNFYNGGGVAIGDINNDGFADIFLTANMGNNKLYLNKGSQGTKTTKNESGFHFEDISQKAGIIAEPDKWSTGVVMADINSDGWLDIYVCNAGYINGKTPQSKLYINNHDLTFTEKAEAYGLTNRGGYATHAAFFDYDLDGDLDAYLLNNSFIPVNTLNYSNKRELRAKDWPVQEFLKGGGSFLLRNENGKFVDVSEEAGIYGSLISFGLGVTVGDVNGDHYPDIYVSNDFFERDYLYINQKNGKFKEELELWMQHISQSSMGADLGDINNDGYPDLFVTDMLPDDDYRLKTTSSFENIDVYRLKQRSGFYNQFMQNTLQVNNRNGNFMETGFYSGVAASDWSWGGLIFDADNDGLSDIFVCNGIYRDVTDQDFIDFFANDVIQKMVLTGQKEQVDEILKKMPSNPIPDKFFRNQGNLKFADSGMAYGFTQPSFSNGAAYGDLDNDGDLDLVINNINANAFVYKNNSRENLNNNFIGVSLKGTGKNTFAVGSKVIAYQGDQVISRELIPTRGFQSSVDYKIILGLGKGQVDSLVVIWPDLAYTKIDKPEINKVHTISRVNTKTFLPELSPQSGNLTLLEKLPQTFDKHKEDDFIDFYSERNIPMMISREGPKDAVADVNGDGLMDIFIGGAAGEAGQLYIQTSSGFLKKKTDAFEKTVKSEDVTSLFFDCDGDGDPDLFVGAGGNNHPPHSKEMLHRLFINDGKGNFVLKEDAFPENSMNISIAIANDFDSDGDLDLFVGGRSVPYNYGLNPLSYLFSNDGKGKFTDVIKLIAPGLAAPGLITGAVWADVTGDKQKELIVAGEWMTPLVFAYQQKRFVEIKTNLDSLFGWWQTISAADLDGDSDEDLVLGNIGENFYLHPGKSNPVKLWINDFDKNGIVEKIITRAVGGKDVPVFLKRDLTEQIVSLRKQNLLYADYGKKSIQDLFGSDLIDKSKIKLFNYSSSCIAWNEGNGKFRLSRLPDNVQFSSVNAVLCTDINSDGKTDLILGGNKFGFLPQFSRLDASFGHVLINKDNSNFDWLPPDQSGLNLRGEIRDICKIQGVKRDYLLFLQNNDYPALYLVDKKSIFFVKRSAGKGN